MWWFCRHKTKTNINTKSQITNKFKILKSKIQTGFVLDI